eukprot:293165-Hanusia_phi.AAC.1
MVAVYGTTGNGVHERLHVRSARNSKRTVVAVASVAVACLCAYLVIASEVRSGPAMLLFPTPTLKNLLGTFMRQQGASKSDISKMNKYYSNKGRVQMLDDVSS